MKRKLLSLAALLMLGAAAHAQINGVTITPAGATGGSTITITVDPTLTCPVGANNSLSAGSIVRLHSGVSTAAGGWTNGVDAENVDVPAVTGFTLNSAGKWQKTFVPSAYYGVAAAEILGFQFVLNSGPAGSMWNSEGKLGENGACGNFEITFPLAGAITGPVSVKGSLTRANLLTRVTNPVRKGSATEIAYNLPKAEKVTVKVTNMLGQEVATLVNAFQAAGEQSVRFDAANLNSGMYFYTVQAGNLTDTKKIVIAE